MAMTVITISSAPMSLRGDLTKWMQEIATGVYVGNLNSRVREELWSRVIESVGKGQATLSFAARNEIGYQFNTYRTKQVNVSFDGIPLVMIPREEVHMSDQLRKGFSNQAKFRQARRYAGKRSHMVPSTPYIVVDIETDGLNPQEDNVIEIAALRVGSEDYAEFHCLVQNESELPSEIVELTGITDQMLADEGESVSDVLADFVSFIGDLPLVGYNLLFDVEFINRKLSENNMPSLRNRKIDLIGLVKKEKMFLKSYRLEDVLLAYGIEESVPHRALEDARLTLVLSTKVNEFGRRLNRKR